MVPSSDGRSVVLLTDDQSSIDEAHQVRSDLQWVCIPRKRHYGTSGGYNGHLSSGDPKLEMTFLMADLKVASQCRHLVFTKSGFQRLVLQAVQIMHYSKDLRLDKIDWGKQPNSTHYNLTAAEFFNTHGLRTRAVSPESNATK